MTRLSTELQQYFFEEERSPQITLADILQLAGERTFGFLFVLLSLPSAVPVPAPGYSVPFGIVMFLLARQLIVGKESPVLPDKIMHRSLDLKKVQGFVKAGIPWLRRIEIVCRPRLTFICTGLTGRAVIGMAIALMSVLMMIPIPGTNTIPAMGIFLTGFGLLDDDGVITLAGLVVCGMGLAVSASVVWAFWFGGSTLIDLIKQWVGI